MQHGVRFAQTGGVGRRMGERQAGVRLAVTARRLAHDAARNGVGIGVLLVLAFLAYRMVLAPVHGTRDAAGCRRAYAAARTHGDTSAADFLSYPDPRGHGTRRRCFDVRPLPAVAVPH